MRERWRAIVWLVKNLDHVWLVARVHSDEEWYRKTASEAIGRAVDAHLKKQRERMN